MNEKTEQIKAVMSDEAFVKSCFEAENEEAVQKLFADKGIEMSLTEIEIMKELVTGVANGDITEEQLEKLSNAGELSEDELEAAAGGGIGDAIYDFFHVAGFKATEEATISTDFLRTGRVAGAAVGGVVIAVGAAYGIAKACGVDVEGGVKKACGWVADNITRW